MIQVRLQVRDARGVILRDEIVETIDGWVSCGPTPPGGTSTLTWVGDPRYQLTAWRSDDGNHFAAGPDGGRP